MPHKSTDRKGSSADKQYEMRLAVKDALREVSFGLQKGVKTFAKVVEDATELADPTHSGPLTLIGAPLNLAARSAVALLNSIDHAAADLLASDREYRAMAIPMHPSFSYFVDMPLSPQRLKQFTKDHFWRFQHWLALNHIDGVFVREQAVEQACASATQTGLPFSSVAPVSNHIHDMDAMRSAMMILALIDKEVLCYPAIGEEQRAEEMKELNQRAVVSTVLAGHVARELPTLEVHERYLKSLQYADEITRANSSMWGQALQARDPVEALVRWFSFVVRHI